MRHIRADGDDFDAEFVPENARVSEKRLAAGVGVQVSAAHADAMNAHERLVGGGRICRRGNIKGNEFAGGFERER